MWNVLFLEPDSHGREYRSAHIHIQTTLFIIFIGVRVGLCACSSPNVSPARNVYRISAFTISD